MAYDVFREEFVGSEPDIKKRVPRVVYTNKHRTGKIIDIEADRMRKSLPAGKRISKNGKVYYENRKNRSDVKGLNV